MHIKCEIPRTLSPVYSLAHLCCRFLDDQVILHWQHYTRRRAKLFEAASGGQVTVCLYSFSYSPALIVSVPYPDNCPCISALAFLPIKLC